MQKPILVSASFYFK